MTSPIFFYYFSGGAIISALLTVGLRSPIYCTVALLSALVHVAGLFVLLNAEFVFAIQIIIYAGAVLVLYLFVMMLLNVKTREPLVQRQSAISAIFAAIILVEILLALFGSWPLVVPNPVVVPAAMGNTEAIGLALFTDYLLPFEVIGIILLGGAVGALILAKQVSAATPIVPSPASGPPRFATMPDVPTSTISGTEPPLALSGVEAPAGQPDPPPVLTS